MGGATRRAKWGKKIEFILTCVAYSVGLGNVWRFPYLAFKNGGGAFLIPYWLTQIFVGMPIYFMELSFGQFASQGPITIWRANRLFKGVGISMVIVCAFIMLYYNVVVSYCCFYFFSSMQSPLPWTHCNHYWNSPNCRVGTPDEVMNSTSGNWSNVLNVTNTTANVGNYTNGTVFVSPTQEYFERFALEMTDGLENFGGLNWKLSLCLLFAWIVVFLVLIKGIQSLGKVVYFTAIFPHILLMSLLIRSALLPGATDGMLYFLTPRWSRLADATVWSDAATQVFFSLGVCMGGLNIMASFNTFKNNTFRDSLLVPSVDCFTSLVCGLVVFSVLGFMAHIKGVSIEEVATGGPGLAFIAYPEALASMPAPTVWAILFFFMMVIIGFSSQFSMVETVISSICDEFPTVLRKNFKRTVLFRFIVCASTYLLALPMTAGGGIYLLNILDSSIGGFPLLIIGISEVIAVMFVYGYNRFTEDIAMMLGKKPSKYFKFCWCFMSPVILVGVLVFKSVMYQPLSFGEYSYPVWAQFLGWFVVIGCVIFIPFWLMYYFYKHGGCQLMKSLSSPTSDWGPSLPENRTGRYATTSQPTGKQTSQSIPSILISGPEEHTGGIYNAAYSHDEDMKIKHQKGGMEVGKTVERLVQGSAVKKEVSDDMNEDKPPSCNDNLIRSHSINSTGSFKGCIDGSVKGRASGSFKGGIDGSIKGPSNGSFKDPADGSIKGFANGSIKGRVDDSMSGGSGRSVKSRKDGSLRGLFNGGIKGTTGYDTEEPIRMTTKGPDATKVLTNGSIRGFTKGSINGPADGSIKGLAFDSMRGRADGSIKGREDGSIKGRADGSIKGLAFDSMKGRADGSIKGRAEGSMKGRADGSIRSGFDGSIKRRADGSYTSRDFDGMNGSIRGRNDGSIRGWINGNTKGRIDEDYRGLYEVSITGHPNGSIKGRLDGSRKGRPDGSIKGWSNGSMNGSRPGSINGREGSIKGWSKGDGSTENLNGRKRTTINVTKTNQVFALDEVNTGSKTEKKISNIYVGGFGETKVQKREVYALDEPVRDAKPTRSPQGDKIRGGIRVFPLDDPTTVAASGGTAGSTGGSDSFRRSREVHGIRAAPSGSVRSLRRENAIEEDYVATVEG